MEFCIVCVDYAWFYSALFDYSRVGILGAMGISSCAASHRDFMWDSEGIAGVGIHMVFAWHCYRYLLIRSRGLVGSGSRGSGVSHGKGQSLGSLIS